MTGRRLRYGLLTALLVLWTAAFTATHVPCTRVPGLGVSDKTMHTVGYFGLGCAYWLTLLAWRVRRVDRVLRVAVQLAAYAAFDELTQSLVPGRSAAFGDWLADTLGAANAVLACECALTLLRRSRRPS